LDDDEQIITNINFNMANCKEPDAQEDLFDNDLELLEQL